MDDQDSGVTIDSTTVTVTPGPVAIIQAPDTGDEGSLITFDGSTSTGGELASSLNSYAWDFGDGNVGTGAVVQHTYEDDSSTETGGTYKVTLLITNNFGATADATIPIAIRNVDPVIINANANPSTVNEGNISRITVLATDVTGDLPDLRYSFDCDDNGAYEVGPQVPNTADCPFPDDSVHTVVFKVTDDGGETTGDVTVTVNNVAPQILSVIATPPTVNEAGVSLITINATDVPADVPDLLYSFDCDDNGTFEVGPQAPSTADCPFPDDSIHTVVVKVDDGDGGVTTGSANVNVNNLNPIITDVSAGPRVIPSTSGGTSLITIVATDVSADTPDLLYSFDCTGDGDFDDPGDFKDQGHPDNDATCTFTGADIGANFVLVRVLDQDGGVATGGVLVVVVGTPAAPIIISPDRESADPDASFTWLPDVLGKYYDLQITSGANFTAALTIWDILHIGSSGDPQTRTLSVLGVPSLASGDRFIWRVRAKAGTGEDPSSQLSQYSASASFITRGATVDLTIEVRLEGTGDAPVDFAVRLYDPTAFRGIDAAPWLLLVGHRAGMVLRTDTFLDVLGTADGSGDMVFMLTLNAVVTNYYYITVEAERTLVNLKDDVPVDTVLTVDMGTLLAGNAVDDTTGVELSSAINALDTSALMAAFGTSESQPFALVDGDLKEYDPRADFNRDGQIDDADFAILKANYLRVSPIEVV